LPDTLGLGEIRQVLQSLLREQVSIRDLPTILEALADQVRIRRDLPGLVEAARHALGRSLVEPYVHEGRLQALVLHPETEQALYGLLAHADPQGPPPVPPDQAQRLWTAVQQALDRVRSTAPNPVLLCGTGVRFAMRQLLERPFPRLPVIAYTECPPDLTTEAVAVIQAPFS
jgi:flagellar biosynthesis protein FlhA